jgi:hypothetical protein
MKYLTNHPVTWATVVALIFATLFGHYWIWGSLFLWWSYTSFLAGEAFIGEIVNINENPPLFWTVTVMWFSLGTYYVVQDLAWRLFGVYFDISQLVGANPYGF